MKLSTYLGLDSKAITFPINQQENPKWIYFFPGTKRTNGIRLKD